MSLYSWIQAYRADAKARQDAEGLRMLSLYDAALGYRETDPHKGLSLLAEARELAVRLEERWWILQVDHWRLQLFLHYLGDIRPALDLAVRATLEARKPEFEQFPQRICLHEDLVYAYLYTDPQGYTDLIEPALDYMKKQVGEDLDCRHCLQACATQLQIYCGRLEEGERSARRALEMAENGPDAHHMAGAHAYLCDIAFERGNWDDLRGHGEAGEETARNAKLPGSILMFLLWRAVAAQRFGDEEGARRLMRQAVSRAARLKSVRSYAFYNALATLHVHFGDLDATLAVRDQELASLAGKGQLFEECLARNHRCRLLARMGLPLSDDLAAAREAANRLRDPAPHLEELARIEAGDSNPP